ncbi:isoflavone 2'-hydroxylase-like protein [Carex littledalei]|uniref:Isoflavone 2'-hydroxylase-like protein n=1 Tax=Carex littledalei TaxID=544730 RepID=A0A833VCH8_9POAL|nr:isoflavone 2'-hydroxylase-like protein [Carex littledalei]
MEPLYLIGISLLLSSLLLKLFLAPKSKHISKLPPSPPSLPIIGHLHLLKKPLHHSLSQLSARYGPILYLRFGYRPTLVISSPQLAEQCFTTNDVAFANRPNFPSVKEVTNNHTTIIFSKYGPLWRNLRKVATVQDWDEATQFRQLIEKAAALASGSRLVDFFPWFRIVNSLLVHRELKAVVKRRNEFSQGLIDEIRKGVDAQKKKTMIGDLLGLQDREPEVYTDALIRSLNMSLLQAGTDTSSNTIEWAMSLLLNNPHALAKAQHEIDTVVGRERLVEESDVSNLSYLRAIINETLRLHPVVPLDVPHESATECFIDGYRVPSETTLLINIHAIHRDPAVWKDPTEFRPERFENGKAEGMWFLPFGMGRRKCPGEGLAIRMIALALGTMIQCFEWESIGGKEVDMTEAPGIVMAKVVRLDAMYRPRTEMVPLLVGL